MTKVIFEMQGAVYKAFSVYGHAGYGEFGKDVVCSAVSSLTIHTVNVISDDLKCDVDIRTGDGEVSLKLNARDEFAELLIKALKKSLEDISQQYPRFLKVEVKL